MSTTKAKVVKNQSGKKLLLKKQTVKPVEETVTEPVIQKPKKVTKKSENVTESLVKAKSVKTSGVKKEEGLVEQHEEVKSTDETVKKVKKVKKINDKPTISDNSGLNLSVAKVKNIISNLCINKEQFLVLKELKDARVLEEENLESESDLVKDESLCKRKRSFTFSLDDVSSETYAFLEKAHQSNLELLKDVFTRAKIKSMDEDTKKDYLARRKASMTAHQTDQKNIHLFQSQEFNVAQFNVEWDADFYKDMENPDWKSLTNMELYEYCVAIVNKLKVRFNSESKIFVTAFVEHIVQQMIVNGTINCVNNKKKIIKLEHALDTTTAGFKSHFSLFPLILNLESYHKIKHEDAFSEEESEGDVKTEEPVESEQVDRKYQFKYYVTELCRTVKLELAKKDKPDDISKSVYYNISVSKVFKNFCSSVIVDLIRMFGEVLKVEVATRNVKTVNYTIIQTLIHVIHIMYGLNVHLDETVKFIQERYCLYQKYVEERKVKRGRSEADVSE